MRMFLGDLARVRFKKLPNMVLQSLFRLHISGVLKDKWVFLRDKLLNSKPHCISSDTAISWHLFTDASYSPEAGGGLGAVLVDHQGSCVSWFSLMVDNKDLAFLEGEGSETIIGELERLVVATDLGFACGF